MKKETNKKLYLVTGATGHLGTILIQKLVKKDCAIRIFCLPSQKDIVPSGVEVIYGDIRNKEDLLPFFDTTGYEDVTLIHAAAKISILSKEDPTIWDINVNGTKNVMELALQSNITKVIYVSSIHALPERPKPELIHETKEFTTNIVEGQYAKSKAEAARLTLEYANQGLPVCIIHPTGVIGPGDLYHNNHSVLTLQNIHTKKIPCAIEGGYDFVDVRDVVDGILKCEEKGRNGECYILSGSYVSVSDMFQIIHHKKPLTIPTSIVKIISPLYEKISLWLGDTHPLLTPYSLYTLQTNSNFSHEKATKELGFQPRSIEESIKDSL